MLRPIGSTASKGGSSQGGLAFSLYSFLPVSFAHNVASQMSILFAKEALAHVLLKVDPVQTEVALALLDALMMSAAEERYFIFLSIR